MVLREHQLVSPRMKPPGQQQEYLEPPSQQQQGYLKHLGHQQSTNVKVWCLQAISDKGMILGELKQVLMKTA